MNVSVVGAVSWLITRLSALFVPVLLIKCSLNETLMDQKTIIAAVVNCFLQSCVSVYLNLHHRDGLLPGEMTALKKKKKCLHTHSQKHTF